MLLILMPNDIHLNPGPQPNFQNNCFNYELELKLVDNSIFNYDLISICETNLDNSV